MKDKEALRQGLKANPKLKHTEDCYPQLIITTTIK